MSEPSMHPVLEPLSFLLGFWEGEGRGEYSTIEQPFAYAEHVRFIHIGRPFLIYAQRTWNPETKAPMHGETGYWRPAGDGRVEVVLAHPTGVVEIQEGTVAGRVIELRSTAVARTSTAKEVSELRRTFRVEDDVLHYEVSMAAVGAPLQPHLRATLRRADA